MSDYPNLDRLAQADPYKLSHQQRQMLVFHGATETFVQSTAEQVMLAHIDELYGEINALKEKCGKQAKMLAKHCERRDEALALLDRVDTLSSDELYAGTFIDGIRNALGGGR